MNTYELSNNERLYFGLIPVNEYWDRQMLSETVSVYFDKNIIAKVLNYSHGYLEYDTDIHTIDRTKLTPRSTKGREQKLTVAKLLKVKGRGIQFSISFYGGGIRVYDNKRDVTIIQSYYEDGQILNFDHANAWIRKFVANVTSEYFVWLNNTLAQKRVIQKAKPGDIIAFKVAQDEYGFARILKGIMQRNANGLFYDEDSILIHPRSLTVAVYAFTADSLLVDLDSLILRKTLPFIYIFDNEVYYGEMPIIGYRPLSEKDLAIPLPTKISTGVTINYTKTDVVNFINENS